jgi:YD repeat-containing protein
VGAYGAVPGTFTDYNGPVSEDIIWGAGNTNGGVSLPNIPFPSGAVVLFGTASYDAPAFDNAQGNPQLINAHWNATYMFSPAPDDNCKDCKDQRGSQVSIHNQSLGEDIAIVGTGLSLHYESNRAAGRAGANLIAIKDALSLGGWTLSVHHALDPLLMAWCAGGSCTPYAVVPKALILGDGELRDSAQVQAPLSVGSNLYLTSEDGSEIYVFDAVSWKHMQTLTPLTGAVLYSFTYDAAGQLSSITDGNGNVTTVLRDINEHPIAIVSPYGQTTTLAVDANGYLNRVTDPLGQVVTLTNTASGLLTSLTDANGNLYSFQYDSLGFLLKDSDPAGGVLSILIRPFFFVVP